MRNVLGYSILIYFLFAQSCGAVKLSSAENDVDPQQILQQLVPEIQGLIIVPAKDLEPNPPDIYHRYAFIRGDFNRDGTEDIAICATDEWVQKGGGLGRNGYVLIASIKNNRAWARVFFHKLPGTAYPFLIWDRGQMVLLVGANFSDADHVDIVWDRATKQYQLVPAKNN